MEIGQMEIAISTCAAPVTTTIWCNGSGGGRGGSAATTTVTTAATTCNGCYSCCCGGDGRCCSCRSGGHGCQRGSNSASAATAAGCNGFCCCCCCTTSRWHSGRSPSDGRRRSGCLHRCSGTPPPAFSHTFRLQLPGCPPLSHCPHVLLSYGLARRGGVWSRLCALDGVWAPPCSFVQHRPVEQA